jgi:hypothetical protein
MKLILHTVHLLTAAQRLAYGLENASIPDRGNGAILSVIASRPAQGPIQSPIQWVSGPRTPGGKAAGVHLHLVPRLRMRGAGPPLPRMFP